MSGVVRLTTGAEVPEAVVATTMLAIRELVCDIENPMAVYELAMLARDSSHRPFGNTATVLKGLGLLEGDGHMHDIVRQIVLAAVIGDDFEMRVVDPEVQS